MDKLGRKPASQEPSGSDKIRPCKPLERNIANFDERQKAVHDLEQKWKEIKSSNMHTSNNRGFSDQRKSSAQIQRHNREDLIYDSRNENEKLSARLIDEDNSVCDEDLQEPSHIIYEKFTENFNKRFDMNRFSRTGDLRQACNNSEDSNSLSGDEFKDQNDPFSPAIINYDSHINEKIGSSVYFNKLEDNSKGNYRNNFESRSETFIQKMGNIKSNPHVQNIFQEVNSNLQKVFVNIKDLDTVLGSKDRSISRERTSMSINKIIEKQRANKMPSIQNIVIPPEEIHSTANNHNNEFCRSDIDNTSFGENELTPRNHKLFSQKDNNQMLVVDKELKEEISDALRLIKHKLSESEMSFRNKSVTLSQVIENYPTTIEDLSKKSLNIDDKFKQKLNLEEIDEIDRETENDFNIDKPVVDQLKLYEMGYPTQNHFKNSASLDRKLYKKLTTPHYKPKNFPMAEKRITEKIKDPKVQFLGKSQKIVTRVLESAKPVFSKLEPLNITDNKGFLRGTCEQVRDLSANRQIQEVDSFSVNRPIHKEKRNYSEHPANKFISNLKLTSINNPPRPNVVLTKNNTKIIDKAQDLPNKTVTNKKISTQLASNISRKIISKRYGDFGDEFEKRFMIKTPLLIKPRTTKILTQNDKTKAELVSCKVSETVQPYYKKIFPKCA
jgi:hypothetical protein